MKNIEELFLTVKEAEVNAHIWHLQTGFYGEHKAFEELYTSLRDNIDSLIELFQGKTGIRINPQGTVRIINSDPKMYLEKLSKAIEEFININFSKDKDLENTALALVEDINKVRYLLTLG